MNTRQVLIQVLYCTAATGRLEVEAKIIATMVVTQVTSEAYRTCIPILKSEDKLSKRRRIVSYRGSNIFSSRSEDEQRKMQQPSKTTERT